MNHRPSALTPEQEYLRGLTDEQFNALLVAHGLDPMPTPAPKIIPAPPASSYTPPTAEQIAELGLYLKPHIEPPAEPDDGLTDDQRTALKACSMSKSVRATVFAMLDAAAIGDATTATCLSKKLRSMANPDHRRRVTILWFALHGALIPSRLRVAPRRVGQASSPSRRPDGAAAASGRLLPRSLPDEPTVERPMSNQHLAHVVSHEDRSICLQCPL